jgi:hypothetical protein
VPARVDERCVGDEKFERLVALKGKYDPDNVFAPNQNTPAEYDPAVVR